MIYRTAPFSMTLNDPYPGFKVIPFFDAEYIRNGTIYRHSFNGILIGTYTRPTQQCRFEWPWVNLSDLAKYSMTRSVAKSLRKLSFLFVIDNRICVDWRLGPFTIDENVANFMERENGGHFERGRPAIWPALGGSDPHLNRSLTRAVAQISLEMADC